MLWFERCSFYFESVQLFHIMYAVLHDVIDKFASARNGDEHNQAHLCLKEMVEQNDQLQYRATLLGDPFVSELPKN